MSERKLIDAEAAIEALTTASNELTTAAYREAVRAIRALPALTAQPAGAKVLRDESTPEGKKIWADVDKAASRAPDWTKAQFGPHPTICGGCGGDGTRQNPYQRACKYASQHPNDPRYVWDEPAPLTVAGAIGRDEFEAWAKSEYMAVHRNGGKQYVNTPTQHAWLGWQAATRNLRVVRVPTGHEVLAIMRDLAAHKISPQIAAVRVLALFGGGK